MNPKEIIQSQIRLSRTQTMIWVRDNRESTEQQSNRAIRYKDGFRLKNYRNDDSAKMNMIVIPEKNLYRLQVIN